MIVLARVANLPNTEYFQQPFQCLRIAPTTSDISPPITQQTASQVAIPYTNQYPFQRLQLSPRPTPPSPSYAFTPLPSRISSTFWEPLHTPEHLPYMNIDTQTLQEDTTPQQLPLPQRRLSTTHYTTTCIEQDIVQPLTPTVPQQLPEQHCEASTNFFFSIIAYELIIDLSDVHDIIPTTIRTTTMSATHVVDIPPLLTPTRYCSYSHTNRPRALLSLLPMARADMATPGYGTMLACYLTMGNLECP